MPPFSTITVLQMQVLRNCSPNTARKELRQIKDSLGVKDLTARLLAAYWSVPLHDLSLALGYK